MRGWPCRQCSTGKWLKKSLCATWANINYKTENEGEGGKKIRGAVAKKELGKDKGRREGRRWNVGFQSSCQNVLIIIALNQNFAEDLNLSCVLWNSASSHEKET